MSRLCYINIMRTKKNKNKQVIDDYYVISKKKGNGVLTRKVWVDKDEEISRYALPYINLNITTQDSGRVLGYDNAHGYHHKHLMGKVYPIKFKSFEDVECRFEKEFEELHDEYAKKR